MITMEILTYPDTFLKQSAKQIENIDEKIQKIINGMYETITVNPGLGLAAIQVGVDKSILIYDELPGEEKQLLKALINPRIITREGSLISENEGCLSVPDLRANVKRFARVLVEGVDEKGSPLRIEAEGLLAIILQHEIDHLNGTLFLDRVSALKRGLYKKRVKKRLKKDGEKK